MVESKLKTILLGSTEQSEARRKSFNNYLVEHPIKCLARRVLEPGYAIRELVYPTSRLLRRWSVAQSLGSTFVHAMCVYHIATKLGEYLGN